MDAPTHQKSAKKNFFRPAIGEAKLTPPNHHSYDFGDSHSALGPIWKSDRLGEGVDTGRVGPLADDDGPMLTGGTEGTARRGGQVCAVGRNRGGRCRRGK